MFLSINQRPVRAALALLGLTTFAACTEQVADTPAPSVPISMVVVSGNNQSGVIGTELSNPLVVRVLNVVGAAMAGQVVNWRVTSGSGQVFGGVSITDGNGYARERWTLGPVEGTQTVEARAVNPSTGEKLSYGTFTATATPLGGAGSVASVTVTPASSAIAVGGTVQLTATLRDAAGNVLTGRTVTWASGNTAAATVNSSGLVTGVASGSATITATSEGQSGSAGVTVSGSPPPPPPPAPVATVTITPATSTIDVGATVQLNATTRDANGNVLTGRAVTWSSSSSAVASVNSTGLVTGNSQGQVTIMATSEGRSGTASVTVNAAPPPPPPPPPPGGTVLFQSNWSAATGNSDAAHSDGGKWDSLICSSSIRSLVLSVVPGSQAGWTLTPNVLQVTNRGGTNCGMVETTQSIPQATSFYIRMYIRVEDENQVSFHSVDLNPVGSIQAPIWSIWDPVERVNYNPKFTIEGTSASQYRRWKPAQKLQQGVWYRFEWHVEMINTSTRTARIWPRIYDMNNNLLFDANSYVGIDQNSITLGQYYAQGGTNSFANLDWARRFGMGYEGTNGAASTGRKWYYAGVEVRSDTWPGPIR